MAAALGMARGPRPTDHSNIVFAEIRNPDVRVFVAAKGEQLKTEIALGAAMSSCGELNRVESIERMRRHQALLGQASTSPQFRITKQAQRGWCGKRDRHRFRHGLFFLLPRHVPAGAATFMSSGQPSRALTTNICLASQKHRAHRAGQQGGAAY